MDSTQRDEKFKSLLEEGLGNRNVDEGSQQAVCCLCLESKSLARSHYISNFALRSYGQDQSQYGGSDQAVGRSKEDDMWVRFLLCSGCEEFCQTSIESQASQLKLGPHLLFPKPVRRNNQSVPQYCYLDADKQPQDTDCISNPEVSYKFWVLTFWRTLLAEWNSIDKDSQLRLLEWMKWARSYIYENTGQSTSSLPILLQIDTAQIVQQGQNQDGFLFPALRPEDYLASSGPRTQRVKVKNAISLAQTQTVVVDDQTEFLARFHHCGLFQGMDHRVQIGRLHAVLCVRSTGTIPNKPLGSSVSDNFAKMRLANNQSLIDQTIVLANQYALQVTLAKLKEVRRQTAEQMQTDGHQYHFASINSITDEEWASLLGSSQFDKWQS